MGSKILGIILILTSFLIYLTPLGTIPFVGIILFLFGIYNIFNKKTTGVVMIVLGTLKILSYFGMSVLSLGIGFFLLAPSLISGIILLVVGVIFVVK
ncbi:MAG: hypothetical protein GF368_02380 [Candidatus Aenigmarchaeota archaeon]|nr:hypothetical protein [Candidatus Aenigmarchaeota archaeon]